MGPTLLHQGLDADTLADLLDADDIASDAQGGGPPLVGLLLALVVTRGRCCSCRRLVLDGTSALRVEPRRRVEVPHALVGVQTVQSLDLTLRLIP
jgi:hypothetical protein